MAKLRVIGGRAKGHKLKMVPGYATRPITDRVKENLFNILGAGVIETYWLDLFAGTGQVGIEALSRGASGADFVDRSAAAIRTIYANLRHTRLESASRVIQADAFDYLSKGDFQPYDVVFVAPPQYKGLWHQVVKVVDSRMAAILNEDGQVIVQIDPVEFIELDLKVLELVDKRKYGRTLLCFFTPMG